MTHPSKTKGDRAERELAGQLTDLLGTPIRRKLGAGRQDDTGDLEGLPHICIQAKNYRDIARAIRDGLADIAQQKHHANADIGVVAVRRPGGRWLMVLEIEDFATLVRETL